MCRGMEVLFGWGQLIRYSFPNPVLKRLNIEGTKAHNAADKEILEGLEGVGFNLE